MAFAKVSQIPLPSWNKAENKLGLAQQFQFALLRAHLLFKLNALFLPVVWPPPAPTRMLACHCMAPGRYLYTAQLHFPFQNASPILFSPDLEKGPSLKQSHTELPNLLKYSHSCTTCSGWVFTALQCAWTQKSFLNIAAQAADTYPSITYCFLVSAHHFQYFLCISLDLMVYL